MKWLSPTKKKTMFSVHSEGSISLNICGGFLEDDLISTKVLMWKHNERCSISNGWFVRLRNLRAIANPLPEEVRVSKMLMVPLTNNSSIGT